MNPPASKSSAAEEEPLGFACWLTKDGIPAKLISNVVHWRRRETHTPIWSVTQALMSTSMSDRQTMLCVGPFPSRLQRQSCQLWSNEQQARRRAHLPLFRAAHRNKGRMMKKRTSALENE